MDARPESRYQPWELRLFAALPVSPMVFGALVSAATIVLSLIYLELVVGEPLWDPSADGVFPQSEGASITLFASVLFGYIFGGFAQAALALGRDLKELGVSDTDSPLEAVDYSMAGSRIFGWLGIVVMLSITVGMKTTFSTPLSWDWFFGHIPFLLLQTANGWLVGRVSYFAFSMHPELSALTEKGAIDLFDLHPYRVLGRIALRNSFLFIIGITLMIPWMFALPFLRLGFEVLTALILIIPVLMLVLPMRGVHRRIRAAKADALRQLDDELRRARDGVVPFGSDQPGRLADLLAYRAYLVSLPSWPFDSPTLIRFALYMLIPFGSWVCSAFVERIVNTALD